MSMAGEVPAVADGKAPWRLLRVAKPGAAA